MTASSGSRSHRAASRVLLVLLTLMVSACATAGALRNGERAERERDYDQAVVIYTRALQERPRDRNLQLALDRARLRAAQMHYAEGRRLEREARWEDALAEFQIAYDLNPGMADIERALRGAREAMRTELAAAEGQTAIEALIDSTFDAAPPGLDLPRDIALPDSVVFSSESARAVFAALGQLTGLSVVFDAQFRDTPFSGDLRDMTFDAALAVVATSTGNFFRVTAPGTVTIIPDTPAKRREYEEEIIRTFYLSNADVTETIDVLRLVVDLRRLAPVTATNAISIKDTPERIDAAARLIRAIDKARAEVVIEVQLLEVDRQTLRDYGLRFISSGDNSEIRAGESATTAVPPDTDTTGLALSVDDVRRISGSSLFVANPSSLMVRLLETNGNTRILANPQLRTSDGVAAEAHFGERVPVPVTTFTPIAAGGISQQPITSFNYEEIGVNILITPRVHHNDEVSLAIEVEVSNISGTGFGELPQFGNRSITTMIRLRDGETNILAGLIRDDERETQEGIPVLSRIPILGRLFGRTRTNTQETDIVMTLTPHIIRPLTLEEQDLRPFLVGANAAVAGAGGGGAQSGSSRAQPQPRPRPGRTLPGQSPALQLPIAPPESPPDR